jgi:thiol-disulfide isomerase/thioredoxin
MLLKGHNHEAIKKELQDYLLELGKDMAPRRILYNTVYGGFGLSKRLCARLSPHLNKHGLSMRENPTLLQIIVAMGRETCDRLPYLLEDVRLCHSKRLESLMVCIQDYKTAPMRQKNKPTMQLPKLEDLKEEYGNDLTLQALKFYDMMEEKEKLRSKSYLIGSDKKDSKDFVDFAETNPDRWMEHKRFYGGGFHKSGIKLAHTLLKEAPELYQIEPNDEIDASIHEAIGLAAASGEYACLQVKSVPAIVEYQIREYDGKESVHW